MEKLKKHNIYAVFSIFIFIAIFQLRHINDKPDYRHSWALADHYAIALNFKTNNFDFLHPETYCLNPQFIANKFRQKKTAFLNHEFFNAKLENPRGITAIDFPIHQYISAGLMKIFHTTEPFIYRLYSLLISLLGLFYLFKTSCLINKSFKLSLGIVALVLLSPTYNYYSYSFLPTAQSLSCLFIAAFFYTKHLHTNKFKYWLLSITLVLVASLARLPFVIYLIALLCQYFLILVFNRKIYLVKTCITITAISLVFFYFLYNKLYLSYEYGSDFLNYPLTPRNFEDIYLSVFYIFKHVIWMYITPIHYVILLLAIISFAKEKIKLNFKNNTTLLTIAGIGFLIYSFLMLRQFPAHDYYILDTFFSFFVFLIIRYSSVITKPISNKKIIIYGVITLLFFVGISEFVYYSSFRKTPTKKASKIFKKSDKTLDSLQIKQDDKILLLGALSPNNAFIEMKRKGYISMINTPYVIKRALSWDIDYIITQNFNFKIDILPNYPNFELENELIYKNSNFTIYKPLDHNPQIDDRRFKKNQQIFK